MILLDSLQPIAVHYPVAMGGYSSSDGGNG